MSPGRLAATAAARLANWLRYQCGLLLLPPLPSSAPAGLGAASCRARGLARELPGAAAAAVPSAL